LGGPGCTCLDVLDAWSRRRDSTGLLTVLSRGARDLVRPPALGGAPGFPYPSGTGSGIVLQRASGVAGSAIGFGQASMVGNQTARLTPGWPAGSAAGQDQTGPDLTVLASLGFPMTVRLVATVTAHLLDGSGARDDSEARPALTASLFGRAWTALRDWMSDPDLDLDLVVAEAGQGPTFETDHLAGPMRLALPLDWVVEVWGRDLTIVAGRFSLGVIESTASRTTLLSVGPDFGAPKELVVAVR
jgi:hypothetical protein